MNTEMSPLAFIIQKGGPMMYAILASSVVLLTIVAERLYSLKKAQIDADRLLSAIAIIMKDNDKEKVMDYLRKSPGLLPRVLEAGLLRFDHTRDELQNALDNAIQKNMPVLERFITPLGTLATIAPFLGLLGTIIGMINSFSKIAAAGTTGPSVIATGVYEALYTTAAGLAIAIPAVIFYNYFRNRVQNIVSEMEVSGSKLIEIIMLKREGRPFPEDLFVQGE